MYRRATVSAFLLWLLPTALASLVNYTIDDFFGDSRTGLVPTYFPTTNGVWEDQTCGGGGCTIKPDPSKAFNQTYTAATFHQQSTKNVSIIMGFEGVAIYVFFILPNQQGPNIDTTTLVNFTIDGQAVGDFTHVPDLSTNDIFYNQLVFSKTGLANTNHQLIISAFNSSVNVYINFDYAIYTRDNSVDSSGDASSGSSTPSSPSNPTSSRSTSSQTSAPPTSSGTTPVGAIAGGIVGGVVLIGAIVALFFWVRRNKRSSNPNQGDRADINPNMHQNSRTVLNPFQATYELNGDSSLPEAKSGRNNTSNVHRTPNAPLLPVTKPPLHPPSNALRDSSAGETSQVNRSEPEAQPDSIPEHPSEPIVVSDTQQPVNRPSLVDEQVGGSNGGIDESNVRAQIQNMQTQIALLQEQLQSGTVRQAQGMSMDPQLPGYTP